MDHTRKEEKLEERLGQGDVTALEELYRQYRPELYLYAVKLTADQQLAEDAIQDTFVAIWKYRLKLINVKSLRFYLLQSVRNQCLKVIKKRSRFLRIRTLPEGSMLIEPKELRLRDASREVERKLEKALNSLSPRQREIIYLKYYENLDYREIASLLKINYQSVVNHIHRAILKLRTADVLKYLDR